MPILIWTPQVSRQRYSPQDRIPGIRMSLWSHQCFTTSRLHFIPTAIGLISTSAMIISTLELPNQPLLWMLLYWRNHGIPSVPVWISRLLNLRWVRTSINPRQTHFSPSSNVVSRNQRNILWRITTSLSNIGIWHGQRPLGWANFVDSNSCKYFIM